MADTTEQGIPHAIAIAWGMDEVPQRGPARGLSHERIVEVAMRIADEDGLGAVTMQRVAAALGFTTMSLYRYVASKDVLLKLMQDAVARPGEIPTDIDGAGWEEGLRAWARLLLDIYRRHPWVLEIPRGAVSVMMPNSMRVADLGLKAMRELRLGDGEKISVILGLSMYVASFVSLERDLEREGGLVFGPAAFELLGEVVTPERLPHLAPIVLSGGYAGGDVGLEGGDVGLEEDFTFGLERWIDGLRVLHERRAPGEERGADPTV
jgi:AcrR family transcriptional regulator